MSDFDTWISDFPIFGMTYHEIAYAAWQASRQQALDEAAAACDDLKGAYRSIADNRLFTENGRTLHEGMYGGAHNCEAAIKEMLR